MYEWNEYARIAKAAGWDLVSRSGRRGYFAHKRTGRVVEIYAREDDPDEYDTGSSLWQKLVDELKRLGFNSDSHQSA